MKIESVENILEIIKPRPPFMLRVWLFFFLLINRKEGKRLFETFIEKAEKSIQKSEEMIRKVDAYEKAADDKYRKAAACGGP
jgi:arginine utilization protein RocB